MKIYNSLTRDKESFVPQDNSVNMYVCGVTVYDFCHLGHARTYVAFDVINRYLQWHGYKVNYIRNITDIDDKIIKRANERQRPFHDVVDEFVVAMHEDFAALGLLKPQQEPRATEFIPQMIAMITKLIDNDCAYVAANGDVYYSVRQFGQYGCLAHRDIDKLESGSRVEINDVKRDPLDFVLWKLAKPDEPKWPSPWGDGRPGWHIECSAMANSLLGSNFDIHGGGKDLIFPHHENEIAQAEAATQAPFAKFWLHAGYLEIDKQKMSKSLGNFTTIRDALAHHKPEVLRYFLITSHYRSPLHFSDEGLLQARGGLERLYNALKDLPEAAPLKNSLYEEKILTAMDDDFNTPIALSALFDLAHEIQRLRSHDTDAAATHAALLKKMGGLFGILQADPIEFLQSGVALNSIDVEKIDKLIEQRNVARADKNWAEADRIRDLLLADSIALEDAGGKTTWKTVR